MSEENVELIRNGVYAWNDKGIEALIPFASEDVVIYSIKEWPDDPIYRGRDGWRNLVNMWSDLFTEFVWEPKHLIDTGEGVVVHLMLHGTPKGAGVPIAQMMGVWCRDFRGDGTVGELHFFLTWDEASKAAGLSE